MRKPLSCAMGVLLLAAAAPGVLAQHLAAGQQTRITVHVAGDLGIRMPDVPPDCKVCVVRILLPNSRRQRTCAPKTIMRAKLADFEADAETEVAVQPARQGDPGSYALLHVRRRSSAAPTLLTIELQQY